MKTIELSNQEIITFLKSGLVIKNGQFGLIIEINEHTVFKFYYKSLYEIYQNPSKSILEQEIDTLIEIEQFLMKTSSHKETKLNRMFRNFKRFEGTKSENLIQGIAVYKNYPIGIFMRNYKEYEKLTDIYGKLDKKDKEKILLKIDELLLELEGHGVYPRDLKEDNVLVKEEDLDVVLIDLDGDETRFEDEEYIKNFQHIKQEVNKRRDEMRKRLGNANKIER